MKTRIKVIEIDGVKKYIPQVRQWLFWSAWESRKDGSTRFPDLFYVPLKLKQVTFASMADAKTFIEQEMLDPLKKPTVTYKY